MSLVRKDARLAELLEHQAFAANKTEGVQIEIGVTTARDDHYGKTHPVRDFSPTQKKMHRVAAKGAAEWLCSMTPDQRALMDDETFAYMSELASKAKSSR
jgi:hypothetical protein